MKHLAQELRDLRFKAALFCVAVCALSLAILAVSAYHLAARPAWGLIVLVASAVVIALGTASHPVYLPGTKTVVSVSESLVFLMAIVYGPYHACVIGAVDGIVASRKLAKRRIYILIDGAILSLSAFASAWFYLLAQRALERNTILGIEQHTLELVVFPLIAMAIVHYLANISLTAILAGATRVSGFFRLWKESFPWVPLTYLAGATSVGVAAYALSNFTVAATFIVVVLTLPVPFIIYFTFKTYQARVEEERRHLDHVNEIHRSTLEALAMAIDAKDQTTHEHIRRVQVYARRLGEMMRLGGADLKALEAASLLHDIGKLGVPDYILNKPGKLTQYEFEKMKIHPIIGAEILSNVKFDFPVASYVRAHHERWDGCGYPDGLKGEEIPVGARILALVDHFDALHSDRPYRRALTREEAIEHVRKLSGSFFDPALVELFLASLNALDCEVASMAMPEPELSALSTAVVNNSTGPAAGYADECRPLNEIVLGRIAAAHQEVATLQDIARVLSSTLSLQDTVAIITSRIANLVPYSTCVIYLLDPSKSSVRAEYASGLYKELFRGRNFRVSEGITGWVVANHRPMYNTTPLLDLSFLGEELADRFKGVAVFPVMKGEEALGAVALYSADTAHYTEEHIRLLDMIMQPVSDALHNALLFENARQNALTDLLTGLPNMRAFGIHFDRELIASTRSHYPVSILVIDLDDFKSVNDTFGHIVGDRVLASLAGVVRGQLRECDLVARYAGDEFVALLPMTDAEQADFVIGRVQRAIAAFSHITAEGEPVTITASIGAASTPADGQSFEELMMQADKRMYRTKDEGKSRPHVREQATAAPRRIARVS
jgi:diguanylate cyclase (GGDEF)-like protein/putative nucleotidyltransferase with HDIG domain